MSGSRQNEAHCFNENSPRPPVPGEETGNYVSRFRPQSPTLTPRRSSLATPTASGCDASAPLGFEPEGCCSTTTMESDSPPACLRWARNLHSLLQDPVGLELFRKYLDQEGRPHANPLNFWFACEGLKEQDDPERINQLVKLIYRKFFLKSQLAIPEDVRKEAIRRVKEGRADEKVFDAVQLEVERLINETTYPNFLRSDMYLQYVQSCQNPDSGGCPSSGSSREMSVSCGPSLLPTVHEDSEFVSSIHSSHSASETPGELRGELRLTKDMLMATQQTRALDLRPKPEAYAGDGASISKQRSKKQYIRQSRAIKDSASLNRDPLAHHTIIPRTQRVPRDLMHPLKPEEFAQVLIEKLENVKRERESQEKLDRHLQESDAINKDPSLEMSSGALSAKALADALREKLMIEEDNDQAILDQHVSRVWSDLTPSRSPGLSSPRLHSPERRRSTHNYPRPYKQRKEKDVFSTFSADSGNIHDFQEGSDLVGAGSMSSLGSHLPKSKSVPSDYADSLHKQDLYLQGHDQRFRRSDMTRRSATKKSMTELTDSGVSVVSDAPPSTISKDIRLLSWLKETDKKADIKHSRHGKKYGSRSGSLERTNRETWGVPAQPFVADPGMPPLPQPHTATQLEEARRRLIEEDRARSNKQRHSNISKQSSYEPTTQSQSYVQSNQSTLKKTKQDIGDFTTVVFSFCDEQFPYRTKIPGHNITLKQFKEYLPKKGSYRYFFKTECEDLDTKVIQEEITDDSEVLPLWEGKVMAQVKTLE
ncbi:axin isoform X2 [Apis laboriosa]|uniref:axin isoform X2 n=1 Tax=Apis dorsata TaxID=7462 RepID=UPI0003DF5480|nr:axin isoform X2 [Apis dorsata]XP_012348801.1 axin isoform X2 [Apis florea]XP_016912066.1 axin isoform X2 [Apis cerana]XP_043794545.1 axin isoform X2 [Apis laboriosa]XP_061937692.1 axin isoform X2 [Apis cerana]